MPADQYPKHTTNYGARGAAEQARFHQATAVEATRFDMLLRLENQRAQGARADRIAAIADKKRIFLATREVCMRLQFHPEKIIAENVTFGPIDSPSPPGGAVCYGFTCTLTKDGRTGVVPVPGASAHEQLAKAASMVSGGALVGRYRALSRDVLRSYVAENADEQRRNRERALKAALQDSHAACAEFEAMFGGESS